MKSNSIFKDDINNYVVTEFAAVVEKVEELKDFWAFSKISRLEFEL